MAKFAFDYPKELQDQLKRLGNPDRVAKAMIDAATPTLVRNVKKELASHRRTGDMVNSVKQTRASKYKNGSGYYGVVRPTGKDRNGVRNMEKLAHAEYGTSHQTATPILTKALQESTLILSATMPSVSGWDCLAACIITPMRRPPPGWTRSLPCSKKRSRASSLSIPSRWT